MTNWKTSTTGIIAWVSFVSAALATDPTIAAYLAQLGLSRVNIVLALVAVISGILNSSFQRDKDVTDQQAGLRPEVKSEAQVK